MLNFIRSLIFLILLSLTPSLVAADISNVLFLRDNLKRARTGDYIVTAQNKNYTLLHVFSRSDRQLTLEEITVPMKKLPPSFNSWKNWIMQRAPGNTSWIMYSINLDTGKMTEFYSVSNHRWHDTHDADSFLNTLLNIPFTLIPLEDRKKVGFPTLPGMTDNRPFWQPKMVFEGHEIHGIWFDAWKTKWPKDGSELEDKTIEVYIPQESNKYPSYFPYWLQISGLISKAKIRMIDSGNGMNSPVPPIETQRPAAVINKRAS